MNLLQRMYLAMGRTLKLLPSGKLQNAKKLWRDKPTRERLRILRAYYESDDLYEMVQTGLEAAHDVKSQLLALRNVTRQLVEFYVSNVWPGSFSDLVIQPKGEKDLTPAITQIFQWSNWSTRKQVAVRWLARDGNLFFRIHEGEDKVYHELIDALYVVDFEEDVRGNVTMIRIDTPIENDNGKDRIHTEVWEKNDDGGQYREWEHDKEWGAALEDLKQPFINKTLLEEYGIDFVPFVHARFIDTGDKWGRAAIEGVLDKQDEANRGATRLHRQNFRANDVTFLLKSSLTDANGRPLPPPELEKKDSKGDDLFEYGGERMQKLPSGWDITSLIPQLDYASSLAILEAHIKDMERDLPELTWFRLRDQELSGVAIRNKLGEAVTRAEEVQGNLLAALVRLNKMALSIGQVAKLEGFDVETIGTYEEGHFDHEIVGPEVFPISPFEKAEALVKLAAIMPVAAAMRLLDYPADEIADVEAAVAAERAQQEQAQAQATLQAIRDLETAQNLNGQPEEA